MVLWILDRTTEQSPVLPSVVQIPAGRCCYAQHGPQAIGCAAVRKDVKTEVMKESLAPTLKVLGERADNLGNGGVLLSILGKPNVSAL